ncbi:MAG: MFS transporter [Bifidobacterium aquikefiri]|uniref:MFS transporter n=2 Tax=Bifidobacterium aquikefiri TaxID=1653207 RepID=UPI000B9BC990
MVEDGQTSSESTGFCVRHGIGKRSRQLYRLSKYKDLYVEKTTRTPSIDCRLLWSVISMAMLTFLGILSETSLNIAYSSLMRQYGIEASVVQWLTTGYLLVLAIVIPSSTYLVRRFSTVRLFQCAVTIFTLGTILGACAPTFPVLLCARLIMAIGTGISLPLMTNVVLEKAEFHQRGMLMGVVSLVISAGPAIGPVYGGIIMQYLTWHYIFIIMIPFLLIAIVIGTVSLSDISRKAEASISMPSMLLTALGLGSIMIACSFAYEWQADWRFWLLLAFGVLMMVIFVLLQFRLERPLVNVRVFTHAGFSTGIGTIMISQACVLGINFMLPLLLINGLHHNSMMAALILLPGAAIGSIVSPKVGSALRFHFAPNLMVTGFFGMIVAAVLMTVLQKQSLIILVIYVFFMTGASLVATPGQTHSLNQLPASMNADGSAVLNTLQQLSGAVGTAVASILMTAFQQRATRSGANFATSCASAFSNSMPLFIVLMAVAILLAMMLRRFGKSKVS